MDPTALRQEVVAAVDAHIQQRMPFTTAHISNPIIYAHHDVHHIEVRKIIDDMWAQGYMDNAAYTCSQVTITVKQQPVNVRAWHPDDPTFDIHAWDPQLPELDRSKAAGAVATQRGFCMTDGHDTGTDDNVPVSSTLPSTVTKRCFTQPAQGSLNVPSPIIRAAGWQPGETVQAIVQGDKILVQKAATGKQTVDQEGRIRLHGDLVTKPAGVPYIAVLVEAGTDKHIELS